MIYLFDVHSTLYDEHREYVPALNAAIQVFIDAAGGDTVKFASNNEKAALYKKVYAELKQAHVSLQSDWDNRAFDAERMPTLKALFTDDTYETVKKHAIQVRSETSKRLMREHVYPGALEILKGLKRNGHDIYLCTDSNITCAEYVMEALELNDIVDGCYCCASPGIAPTPSENPKIKCFSDGIFKPNAHIVGEILLDYAKTHGLIAEDTTYDGVFMNTSARYNIPYKKWATTKLVATHEILQGLIQETVIVGDSLRDIILGRLAGALTVKAEYGTKSPALKESHAVIHSITHWENCIGPDGQYIDRWNLFGPHVKKHVEQDYLPDYTCTNSIKEMAWMLNMPSRNEIMSELGTRDKLVGNSKL